MDMIVNKFIFLFSTCCDKKYQSLTIDMTKDKNARRYLLGLSSIIVPDISPF